MPGLFTARSREEIDRYGALGFVRDSDGETLCRRCAPVGEALRPVMLTRDWISGDTRYEELSCDSCYRNIDEYENPDYCACGDGCYRNECDSCGDNDDYDGDADDDYFESTGCTCDSCVAASQYQPGSDPEPFTGDEPTDEDEGITGDDEPVEVPPIDWDAVIPQQRRSLGMTPWAALAHYVDAGDRRPHNAGIFVECLDTRSPEGWFCELPRYHDGPHRCFDNNTSRPPLAWVAGRAPATSMDEECAACGQRFGAHYGFEPTYECPMPDGSRPDYPNTWWAPVG